MLTVYGRQERAKEGYNLKKRGGACCLPLLCGEGHSRECRQGSCQPGDGNVTGRLIPLLQRALARLPDQVRQVRVRADAALGLEEGFRPLIENQAVDILHHGCIPVPETPGFDEDGNYVHELTY